MSATETARRPGSTARMRALRRLAREQRARFRQILREENARWQPFAGAQDSAGDA